ncbi:hypothetical protein [Desulfobulbus oligotrophicus]|uniref:Uncharacterized protein n=1 Tax=Desulfobulbus oligotrophicus TaxID=1909699 RepID=A0A7T5VD34_9BACT|nr:hypothetical protein [Desulfobulbus oligotrophicus]QQG65576.1 hypothetical protein HP555_06705 [Desulfobulbus oligotrophicus]
MKHLQHNVELHRIPAGRYLSSPAAWPVRQKKYDATVQTAINPNYYFVTNFTAGKDLSSDDLKSSVLFPRNLHYSRATDQKYYFEDS